VCIKYVCSKKRRVHQSVSKRKANGTFPQDKTWAVASCVFVVEKAFSAKKFNASDTERKEHENIFSKAIQRAIRALKECPDDLSASLAQIRLRIAR
jgi:hypothetical protein